MSQHYWIKIGNVHEEDYEMWYLICRLLHEVGLIDEDTTIGDCNGDATDNQFYQVMDAFRKGDSNPERYVADYARDDFTAMVKKMQGNRKGTATLPMIIQAYKDQLKQEGR